MLSAGNWFQICYGIFERWNNRRRRPTDGPELWRRYMNAVRQQATHLARQGRLEILRKGQPVDPKNFKGVVRLRLPVSG